MFDEHKSDRITYKGYLKLLKNQDIIDQSSRVLASMLLENKAYIVDIDELKGLLKDCDKMLFQNFRD
jgi:hypothetical protein